MRYSLGVAGVILTMVATMVAATAAGALGADANVRPASLVHRYGIEVDLKQYPQGDPRQAIRSVIKAIQVGEVAYLLAHLISPDQVDAKFHGDPKPLNALASRATPQRTGKIVKALRRQLDDGAWTTRRRLAWAEVDGAPALSLEKIGECWFMHNTPAQRPQ